MSNHITAIQSKLIVICYADGVRTVVPTLDWSKAYVIDRIHRAVEYFKQDYDDDTHIGVVWHIDSVLNGLGTSQCMVNAKFNSPMHYIDLPYRYDLGENETEEDVKIFYKNYKYIKNKIKDVPNNE